MFASLVSIRPGPLSAASVGKHSKLSLVERDLEALLDRLRRRRYPETIPVLASYWLKTVLANGYQLRRWRGLNGLLSGLLKRALGEQLPNDLSRQAVIEIQAWIQQTVLTGQTPRSVTPRLEPV